MKRLFSVIIMLLRICTCCRINLFQFTDRKWCFFRICSFKVLIKIWKFRFTLLQLCDDQTHLISPVSQMDISCYIISFKTDNTFNALSDDRRTKMSDMQRFCHVRSAVINNNFFRILFFFNTKILICCHLIQILCNNFRCQLQVDKSRIHRFC